MQPFLSCQKEDDTPKTPQVTEETIVVHATQVTFKWTVDWPGKFASVVEVSENRDMSDSQIFGYETETEVHNFTATVTGLKEDTDYYYRYLIWNQNYVDNKFKTEVKRVAPTGPIGSIHGLFSVSDSVQVYFSKGNLQYQASTVIWRFAQNQWDCLGEANNQISSDNADWIDLFGWGTSRWNCGSSHYMPYDASDYGAYGPIGYHDLTGSYANADWGVYNAISNGGNQAGLWRTLTKDEWVYLFNTRKGTLLNGVADAKFVKAKVNDMAGVILFPDNYTHPSGVPEPNNINHAGASFNWTSYSSDNWSKMEQAGCVFLPASGLRRVTIDGTVIDNAGSIGRYWSASFYDDDRAYNVYFSDSDLLQVTAPERFYGLSVRLVSNAQ